jgi:hypothetical protein
MKTPAIFALTSILALTTGVLANHKTGTHCDHLGAKGCDLSKQFAVSNTIRSLITTHPPFL